MGISQFHDADLLNFLADAGSEKGNFVYVDTSVSGYVETMTDSIS